MNASGNWIPKPDSELERSDHSDEVDKSVHSPERGHSCPRVRWPIVLALSTVGLLSLGVVPPEELEATKPRLEVTQSGGNLILDWAAHPEVFYFMEGRPDLEAGTPWITAKLLKDNDGSGDLSLGTAISNSQAFYRLDLEGDPGAARLREDSDGDGIINLLEVEAGWDAYAAEVPTDSDSDGIPDYFEQFHFGTLEHDENYVAVEGGLTMAEAFAHAADPNSVDSDGDGWTDQQELDWGWDPNYNQSRDDSKYSKYGDFDGDGSSNLAETLNNTDPTNESESLAAAPQYAVIDLGANREFIDLSDSGHIVSWDTTSENAENWFFGESQIFDLGSFWVSQIASDGTIYGFDRNPHVDELGAVIGIQYPVESSCSYDGDNYFGDYITATLGFGNAQPNNLKPAEELLFTDGCYFTPEYLTEMGVSPNGEIVVGYANVDQFGGPQDRFFFSATVDGGEMTSLLKYNHSDSVQVKLLKVNDSGDFLYGYKESSGGDTLYKLNGTALNIDIAFDLGADGRVLAKKNQNIILTDGTSETVLFEGAYAREFFVESGFLSVLTKDVLLIQKADESTNEPVPLSSSNPFTLYPLNDLCQAHVDGWENLNGEALSEDGNFIAASAKKNGIDHTLLLLKMDIDIHQPGTAGRNLLLDSTGAPVQEPDGSLTFEYPLPPEIPEAEQQDPTRCQILINDDNDDLDSIFSGSGIASPYPQDNDDSVLKLKEKTPSNPKKYDDDDVVMVTLRQFDAVNTGKIRVTTSSDSDVRFFKYEEAQYNLNVVNIADMVVDLSNPGTTSPLKDLPNEDVSFYIEGINANSDLTVSMVFEDANDNELARQEVHLEIIGTRILSLSAQGNGQLSESSVKGNLTEMMQGANIVRRDRDGLDAHADVSVPVTFRLGQWKGMDNDSTHADWSSTTSGSPEATDILNYMRDFPGGLDIYVINDITNAGGFARLGAGIMVILVQGSPDDVIAHEWLHAFGDLDHICTADHLMMGAGCDSSIPRGSDVRESEKVLFLTK